MLTQARLKEVLRYNRKTGVFTWRVRLSNRVEVGSTAGSTRKNGYVCIAVDGQLYLAHRLAWLYCFGRWPRAQIDHKRGKSNRISNLREASQSQNNQNQVAPRSNNSSGFLGAFPHQGRFTSQIKVDGKQHYLGIFSTAKEAHSAYMKAKRELHPFSTL